MCDLKEKLSVMRNWPVHHLCNPLLWSIGLAEVD